MENSNIGDDKGLEQFFLDLKQSLPELYNTIMEIQKDMLVSGNISVANIEKLCSISEELEKTKEQE